MIYIQVVEQMSPRQVSSLKTPVVHSALRGPLMTTPENMKTVPLHLILTSSVSTDCSSVLVVCNESSSYY